MKFTKEETALLDTIAGNFSRRAKHAVIQTYKEFIDDLYKFLKEVEDGYTMTIDDYTNDITRRDQADELVESVELSLKKKISPSLEEWDRRFKLATNMLHEPLLGKNQHWWWYRIPKKLIEELKEDVETLKVR